MFRFLVSFVLCSVSWLGSHYIFRVSHYHFTPNLVLVCSLLFYRETTNERQMRTSTPGREVAILLLSTKITSFRIPLRSRALLHQDHRTALKRKAKWSRKSTSSPFATKSTFDDFLTFPPLFAKPRPLPPSPSHFPSPSTSQNGRIRPHSGTQPTLEKLSSF